VGYVNRATRDSIVLFGKLAAFLLIGGSFLIFLKVLRSVFFPDPM
jgi:hypothetical protein